MGKLRVTKTKKESLQPGIKVKKENSMKKNGCRDHHKRLSMLRRRVSALLDEKESLEAKNQEIIENFTNEKKLNAELKKDVFYWQRMYHEAVLSHNAFKVKQTDMISVCLKDIKSAFPHLVGLSDQLCRNQIRLTTMINSFNAENENNPPRAFGDDRQRNSDHSKKSEKQMKQQKVGPMVKGILIQKPMIRLERVMLQQPQEPANNDLASDRGNALTPIVEENEQDTDLRLEQISMRRKKRRLGTGERWRMRKQQEQLENEREKEREREAGNQRHPVSESSDSEDQVPLPVIRLKQISGLLLSPKLLEVNRSRPSEGKKGGGRPSDRDSRRPRSEDSDGYIPRTSEGPDRHRPRSTDDPQEGCSWMHSTPHSSQKQQKRKPETSSSSESSNEESEVEEKQRSSLADSLYKKSFGKKNKSSGSSTANSSLDVSNTSKAEADSTNNVDVVYVRESAVDDSLGVSRNSALSSRNSSRTTPVASAEPSRSTLGQRQSSSFCNNCTPITSPDVSGKRIRKPKIHLYPGEEASSDVVPKSKKGKVSGTSNKAVKSRPSTGSKKKSSIKKNSVESSRTSVTMRLSQDTGETEGRNSRRMKTPISYKEPPANKKMRRP
ncbi:zinc finger CCCH domain-containing protein 13-like [Macrosteles quadrilineatus]|uniref:zinc finger CCCH domain-containing protein 13-like n=1 Tax=Macrosteles quadrilineatus TaxID=74068 RepID=UPI0023E3093A|nr:zinc finger CCCH domain-containing protein 13-like [Macrosteles quadrilineatus]XP_054273474.1 zinc finger CCCH domain-containing protein 13-like [Macrosteles quadrilineatus]